MAYEGCPFDITPYDEANIIKTPTLVNLSYTNQDFWSMKIRLVEYIKQKFGENFNDFVESDLAIMLIENWAFIADTLSFKMDQIANEIFIDTVSEVDNAFRLAMLVGFKPQPPIGSRSLWSASMSTSLETDLTIPAPQPIEVYVSGGPRTIELYPADPDFNPIWEEPIVIGAGNFSCTAIVGIEGRTTSQNYPANGEANQYVELDSGPVIYNSVRARVDGIEWEQVDYFTDSQPRREFRVEYDPNYNAYVIFGNSRAGMIPPLGSTVAISYRVGGGTAGDIVTNSVSLQRNFTIPGFGLRVPVTFTNYTRGEYGYPGDNIQDIKNKLPQWLRMQSRVVSGQDYEIFANQFVTEFHGQIGKSNATLRNHGCAANIVDLYVLARDGEFNLAEASNELKEDLIEALDSIKMITDFVCIKDGVIIDVDVAVDVTVDKFYRKFEEELLGRIRARVDAFFALVKWDYGMILRSGDLIKEIADIKEISSVDVNFLTEDENNSGEIVNSRFYEFIRPSSISINFVYE